MPCRQLGDHGRMDLGRSRERVAAEGGAAGDDTEAEGAGGGAGSIVGAYLAASLTGGKVSFTHLIGTPSDPLPDGVAYYDAECMDGRYVWPLEQSPYMTEGNTMRLDGPAVSAPDVPPVTCS